MFLFTTIALIAGLSLLVYLHFREKYQFFARRCIPHPKVFPLLGNFEEMLLRRRSIHQLFKDMYDQFPGRRLFGYYEFTNPIYVLRDPELVKQICVKNFDNFANHRNQVDEEIDPLIGSNLFSMENQRWKDMRSTLSPVFTGNKIRQMCGLVSEAAKENVEELKSRVGADGIVIEAKTLMTQFANDAIATAVFGVKVNSVKNPDNDFFRMASYFGSFGLVITLKFFLALIVPKFMLYFKIKLFDTKYVNWFYDIINTTMATRRKNNIHRPDLVNVIMELIDERDSGVESTKRHWENHELISQSMVFFLAGFETTSTQVSTICQELMVNREIQNRLIEEIDRTLKESGGKIDYDTIGEMKYLDMVVCEGLRKYPPIFAVDRLCSKETTIEENDGSRVTFQPGDGIMFSIYAIHHDPLYYPDPDKFDPERFNDENRDTSTAYFPFGTGPRSCIGQRLAIMEMKIFLVHLLSDFTLERCEKTVHPIRFAKASIVLKSEDGLWMKLLSRSK